MSCDIINDKPFLGINKPLATISPCLDEKIAGMNLQKEKVAGAIAKAIKGNPWKSIEVEENA